MLAKMQKESTVHVAIDDEDPAGDGADGKLVALARSRQIPIVTNDYGLNRVAELHGVTVLNVNDLAKAVRPVVLPGEEIHVRVIQEGKEAGQGVGYLEDGTMIVVENGARSVGSEVPAPGARPARPRAGPGSMPSPRVMWSRSTTPPGHSRRPRCSPRWSQLRPNTVAPFPVSRSRRPCGGPTGRAGRSKRSTATASGPRRPRRRSSASSSSGPGGLLGIARSPTTPRRSSR